MKAFATSESSGVTGITRQSPPALFTAAEVGDAPVCVYQRSLFDELQNLHDLYIPYVAPFVQTITDETFTPPHPLVLLLLRSWPVVLSWLSGSAPLPPVSYFASVAVPFPSIGLAQLTQYLVAFKVADLAPGEVLERLSGATGHSQGIVSTVAISAPSIYQQFLSTQIKP